MDQNKQNYSNNFKFLILNFKTILLVIFIIILIIIAIIVTLNVKKSQSDQVLDLDNKQIEVVNGENNLPNNSAKQDTSESSNSVQSGPATTQDLGGSNSAPQDIETLLKDKEVEVK